MIPKGQLILEANYGVLDSSKKNQVKITVLIISIEISAQDSDFCWIWEELRTLQIALEIF